MQYIHSLIDNLRAPPDEETTPMGAAITELLDGERGSLPELVDRFVAAGLARIMASWMGEGPMLPISTRDLRNVLGEERSEDLATLAGLTSEEFLTHLARLLPAAVHDAAPARETE
ncbi:MAG TPA: YidB family protein [Acetobacteraceae bacterium]|jgi:uncharacterized protein YidB (DUF937 family)